ncbi:MAG: 5-(carboxyamino)imidazole ribonucleotide mutase [Pseudomonadota bacterium]
MKNKELVLILVGSRNDLPDLKKATETLDAFGVPYALKVASAHRTPDEVVKIVEHYTKKSVKVILAAAGLANHLAGAAAARTICPVIGIPLAKSPLGGLDSLFSTVQMPPGVPVAAVAINGVQNAAILAVQILALSDAGLRRKLLKKRADMRKSILAASKT